ncbi:MAG: hypothetical protein OEZ06_23565 [Myxococcales bacterium]|nr:hypothetical protein [Myxococcales bacterium]
MGLLLLDAARIDVPPADFLAANAEIFARWGWPTHDSGNVSYGVRAGDARFFVKTAGPANGRHEPHFATTHAQRVELLNNAATLAGSLEHPALPALRNVIASPEGPVLVYDFVDGELLYAEGETRDDPSTAYQRFRALPPERIASALDTIYAVHDELAKRGFIACDFYDGSILYDFDRGKLIVCDLDSYGRGAFENAMGRMYGSSRFMAPEEFVRGATIDQRTTVFTLGRTAAVFLSDLTLEREPFRGSDAEHAVVVRACQPVPEQRYASVREFCQAWRLARCCGR